MQDRQRQRPAADGQNLDAGHGGRGGEPGAGQRGQVGQRGVQGGRGRDRQRGGQRGERAGLDDRGGGELAAAGAQGGEQGGLVGAYPVVSRPARARAIAVSTMPISGEREHRAGGEPLLAARVEQGLRQPGRDAFDLHPVAERATELAVGAEQRRGQRVEAAAGRRGQVRAGGDLQPVKGGAAAQQVVEIDQERPVPVDRAVPWC